MQWSEKVLIRCEISHIQISGCSYRYNNIFNRDSNYNTEHDLLRKTSVEVDEESYQWWPSQNFPCVISHIFLPSGGSSFKVIYTYKIIQRSRKPLSPRAFSAISQLLLKSFKLQTGQLRLHARPSPSQFLIRSSDYNFLKMDSARMNTGAKYECLLFDMDDTLYPLSSGLNLDCRKNIQDYMLERLHIEESEVPKMCLDLYKEYGTTMAGLKARGYEFDDDEFHAYVHGRLPYDKLKPDPVLRNLLLSMPQRKIIFTNADHAHAIRVLNRLGLEDCFEGIICFETLNPPKQADFTESILFNNDSDSTENGCFCHKSSILCKPSVGAMESAIRIANVDPKKTIFFDDSVRNIASGKAAGLHTVIVGRSDLVPGADHALGSIHNIKDALPEIWEVEDEQQLVIQSPAVETMVLA